MNAFMQTVQNVVVCGVAIIAAAWVLYMAVGLFFADVIEEWRKGKKP